MSRSSSTCDFVVEDDQTHPEPCEETSLGFERLERTPAISPSKICFRNPPSRSWSFDSSTSGHTSAACPDRKFAVGSTNALLDELVKEALRKKISLNDAFTMLTSTVSEPASRTVRSFVPNRQTPLSGRVWPSLSYVPFCCFQAQPPPKPWWKILDILMLLPSDAGFAIRIKITEAIRAAQAQRSDAAVPVLLFQAVSLYDNGHPPQRMHAYALKVLREYRPRDAPDYLANLQLSPISTPALAAGERTRSLAMEPKEVRVPVSVMKGDSSFRDKIAKNSQRPWFELIAEVRQMKPNNGYPVRCNIVAAIKSAATHDLHRNMEVARLLAGTLAKYSRKCCSATKNEALQILKLMHTESIN